MLTQKQAEQLGGHGGNHGSLKEAQKGEEGCAH
jgi:hypothetical protein